MIFGRAKLLNQAGQRNFRQSYWTKVEETWYYTFKPIKPTSEFTGVRNCSVPTLVALQCGIRDNCYLYNHDIKIFLISQQYVDERNDQARQYMNEKGAQLGAVVKAGIDIFFNGCKEKETENEENFDRSIEVEGITKESLAKKPIKYLLEQYQLWIEIGFSLENDQFRLSYLGVDVEKIAKVPLTNQLYQHDFVDISTRSMIKFQYHTIYKNQRHVTLAGYNKKTKRCILQHESSKQTAYGARGYNIKDSRCYPVFLQFEGDINWKISLIGYDEKNGFKVVFNDQEFQNLPFQLQIVASGPQNIKQGKIIMNGQTILDGFKQYEEFKATLPKQVVLTDLWIGGGFETTSSDVVNQVIDDCSRLIDPERGIEKFELDCFYEKNQLKSWPFSKIVSKALLLHTLKISHVGGGTTSENTKTIIDFCIEVCQATDRLRILYFYAIYFRKEGDKFWSSLANDENCLEGTLEELTILYEHYWLYERGAESVLPITRILQRQGTTLKKFHMNHNHLNEEQKQAIRDALASNPNCVIESLE